MLLQHFQLLCATAKKYGKMLRQPEEPELHFFNNLGEVVQASMIDVSNINTILFTPGGETYLGMTSANKLSKLSSKAGLCITAKPAEPLTSALVVFVSNSRDLKDTVGGTTLVYTTHGSSQWGRTVLKDKLLTSKESWISVLKITAAKPLSEKELAELNAKQPKNVSKAAAEGVKGMPAQVTPEAVDLTAQADSPDIFDDLIVEYDEQSDMDAHDRINKKRSIAEVSTTSNVITQCNDKFRSRDALSVPLMHMLSTMHTEPWYN